MSDTNRGGTVEDGIGERLPLNHHTNFMSLIRVHLPVRKPPAAVCLESMGWPAFTRHF